MTFSFIHAADIHLGRPFSNIGEFPHNTQTKELYKKAVEKAFNNMIEYALSNDVDFVLIAGDTFDSTEQDFESKLILKEGLKKLETANIKVFLICGNHDPLSSYNKTTFDFNENSIIKIVGLNSNFYESFPVKDKNGNDIAKVYALSFKENIFKENPTKYFSQPQEKNLFHIGLLHCDLDGNKESTYAPCSKTELENLKYDYWALGHIHIPDNKYVGTIQGRNTKETGVHGIKYIKVENGKIKDEVFVPVDVVRFEDIEIDISSAQDLTDATLLIQENLQNTTNFNCELFFIRINLTGQINYYNEITNDFFKIICEKIQNDSQGKICISQIQNNTIAKVDEQTLNEDDGIAGTLFKITRNKNNIETVLNSTIDKFKKLLPDCNLSNDEYENFVYEIKNETKEICNNLCTQIFNKSGKED